MLKIRIFTFATVVALPLFVACSVIGEFDLPSVVSDSDGQKRPGKFIWHDLISDDPSGSQAFYGELFGWEFRALPALASRYFTISAGGRLIGGMVDQRTIAAKKDISQWVSVMSVADAGDARRVAVAQGAEVLREPVDVGARGTIAVYADPQGAIFATLETPGGDPLDTPGSAPQGTFFWHELWTSDPVAGAKFYEAVATLGYERAVLPSGDPTPSDFYVLRGGEQLRAGVRDLPAADMPPIWMPYLRINDREALDAVLARVPTLGGQVLVPAQARPVGGFVAVIAGPSGAPLALQTWLGEI